MANLSANLSQALSAREEARRLLASLDRLGAEGSLDDATRDSMRREYEERLQAADTDVGRARDTIGEQRQQVSQELEKLRREETALEVRHKVGEFDLKQYQKATGKLRSRIEGLERQSVALEQLSAAESAEEVKAFAAEADRAAPGPARSAHVTTAVQPAMRSAGAAIPTGAGQHGWVQRLTTGRTPYLLSGALVAIGAIAVIVLFAQAGGGGFSLPNPLSGVSLPGSSAGDLVVTEGELDEKPATTPSTSPPAGGSFTVPVVLHGAPGIGSLHVEMAYDSSAVQVTSIQSSTLPPDSLFEYSSAPGRVTIGMVSPAGLGGDWEVATVTFEVLSSAPGDGQTALVLENVVAHSAENLLQVVATSSPGSLRFQDMSLLPPVVSFPQ
jgi:hypothetical protein